MSNAKVQYAVGFYHNYRSCWWTHRCVAVPELGRLHIEMMIFITKCVAGARNQSLSETHLVNLARTPPVAQEVGLLTERPARVSSTHELPITSVAMNMANASRVGPKMMHMWNLRIKPSPTMEYRVCNPQVF